MARDGWRDREKLTSATSARACHGCQWSHAQMLNLRPGQAANYSVTHADEDFAVFAIHAEMAHRGAYEGRTSCSILLESKITRRPPLGSMSS